FTVPEYLGRAGDGVVLGMVVAVVVGDIHSELSHERTEGQWLFDSPVVARHPGEVGECERRRSLRVEDLGFGRCLLLLSPCSAAAHAVGENVTAKSRKE